MKNFAKSKGKRITAVLLCAVMCIMSLPLSAFAFTAEEGKTVKEYTGFEYSVIPESIVEAFIEKIWVSKDEFRWYLRSENGSSDEFDIDDHIKIASFTLTIKDAKEYLYSFSTRRRVYNWKDINVSVWI